MYTVCQKIRVCFEALSRNFLIHQGAAQGQEQSLIFVQLHCYQAWFDRRTNCALVVKSVLSDVATDIPPTLWEEGGKVSKLTFSCKGVAAMRPVAASTAATCYY